VVAVEKDAGWDEIPGPAARQRNMGNTYGTNLKTAPYPKVPP